MQTADSYVNERLDHLGVVAGVSAHHVHVDTTSFSVSGAYEAGESAESEACVIAITYGYSRDHREERTAVDARARHDPGRRCASVLAAIGWKQQR